MKVSRRELQKFLDMTNSRLQDKVMELDELCKVICKYSAKDMIEQFKRTMNGETVIEKNELRKLMCAMWVLHDLGLISFTHRANGLAIAVQEMLLQDKKIIVSKLMTLLEDVVESVSSEIVSVIDE
ncbi:MAG: hypothetical protein ACTSSJ_02965 [Candidatus Odinarchaeia archaeon]